MAKSLDAEQIILLVRRGVCLVCAIEAVSLGLYEPGLTPPVSPWQANEYGQE